VTIPFFLPYGEKGLVPSSVFGEKENNNQTNKQALTWGLFVWLLGGLREYTSVNGKERIWST
jgi:hypothetical protein